MISRDKDLGCEISTVSCQPLDRSKYYSKTAVVGFWDSNNVQILSFGSKNAFELICDSEYLSALPRSALLYQFGDEKSDHVPHLLIGLADGTLVTFLYDEAGRALESKTTISLGTTAVHLTHCEINETSSVFACGSRAEVLFWNMQRLQHSPVVLKVITSFSNPNSVF